MADLTIHIDMGTKCAECGKGGATPSGLCLGCAGKSMDPKRKMKSPQGRAVQARFQREHAKKPQRT